MTSEEKMVIDTLISMSKSLNKIAVEITEIRKSLNERKPKTTNAQPNDSTWMSPAMITENNTNVFVPSNKHSKNYKKAKRKLDQKSAVENIRDVLNGEYIK